MAAPAPTFDPPASPPRPSRVPGPYRNFRPGGTADPESLSGYRGRGLYPDPGLYYRMGLREPAVAGQLDEEADNLAGFNWRVLAPKKATQEQQTYAAHARVCLESLGGGLPTVASTAAVAQWQYGFGLAGRVFELEETTGLWRLEQLEWAESWQVEEWLRDARGYAYAAQLRGADESTPVDWGDLAHFPRCFTGRNYEGLSKLRCLFWFHEAKRQGLIRAEEILDAFGIGTDDWERTTAGSETAADIEAIRTVTEEYNRNRQRWRYIPFGLKHTRTYGGTVYPDVDRQITTLDHQMLRRLGGTYYDLGRGTTGARAVGDTQRGAVMQAIRGYARVLSAQLTEQLIAPIYRQNGWPLQGMAYVWVTGLIGPDEWRARMEVGRALLDAAQKFPALEPVAEKFITDLTELAELEFGMGAT